MPHLSERLLSVLQVRNWARTDRLHAILDACDTPSVLKKVTELGEARAVSLYKGRAEEDLSGIAPYLVQLDDSTLDWIAETLWPTPWGIFAVADLDLEEMRQHFRRFLVVESPEGEQWYFRFYDPRVLVKFLPTCTENELADFYGPVRAFGVTDPESYGVKVFTRADQRAAVPKQQPVVVRR